MLVLLIRDGIFLFYIFILKYLSINYPSMTIYYYYNYTVVENSKNASPSQIKDLVLAEIIIE